MNNIIVVCGWSSSFTDDVRTMCACGAVIYHRPHAPAGRKICGVCWARQVQPGDVIFVTPDTMREVELLMATEKGPRH